jgi:hypothetical protein
MAKRKARGGKTTAKPARKAAPARRSVKRPSKSRAARVKATRRPAGRKKTAARSAPRKKTAAARARRAAAPRRAAVPRRSAAPGRSAAPKGKSPRLDRARRTPEEGVPTPPSSLDMNRHGSAARTGRAEIAEHRLDHASMTPAITGGDVDASVENAYFSGEEAPGGDTPTPDQDIVDDIGRAIGVEYQDNEELRSSDKVADRDKHRWELDPASSEDYKERK